MRTGLIAFCYCIAATGSVIAADPADKLTRHEFASRHMGTTFRIVLYAADRPKAEVAAKAAFARVAELDRVMSDYNPDSELMRLCIANDADPGKPRKVSNDLMDVLQTSRQLSEKSGGAFDATIGPLSQIWRLVRRTQRMPDAEELAAAKTKVGWRKLVLDRDAGTVTLKLAEMRLDLGGIAKGYAADAATKVLAEHGLKHTLVAAAGDIRVTDPPPGKVGWLVEIAPLGEGMPARNVTLTNAAVSTSGDLVQSVEIAGVRYSHVLDPTTGLGLTGYRSVTVVAPTATQTDGLSTAASILPPEKALEFVGEVSGASLYMVAKESVDAKPVVTKSADFPSGEPGASATGGVPGRPSSGR